MEYLYLGEDADGVSYFETRRFELAENDFAPPAPPMLAAARLPATGIVHAVIEPGWRDGAHPTPRHQFFYTLSGRIRVTAGSGEARELGPGSILELADRTGRGHGSEVLGQEPAHVVFVQLE